MTLGCRPVRNRIGSRHRSLDSGCHGIRYWEIAMWNRPTTVEVTLLILLSLMAMAVTAGAVIGPPSLWGW
jgi:hypothetical protein